LATTNIRLVAGFSIGGVRKDFEIPQRSLETATWQAGEQAQYNLRFDVGKYPYNETGTTKVEFSYPGDSVRTFSAPQDGYYRLEAWGARGGIYSSKTCTNHGGYCAGTIYLKTGQEIHVYVGQRGYDANELALKNPRAIGPAAFNGGGAGGLAPADMNGGRGTSGGGATDFRLKKGATWDEAEALNSRILVAAGGGGVTTWSNPIATSLTGSYGGGLIGGQGRNYTKAVWTFPGDQTGSLNNTTEGNGGRFGAGGTAQHAEDHKDGSGSGGGGGGWYGGDGNKTRYGDVGTGSGGSSFISGMTGCVAIDPTNTENPRRAQDPSLRTEPKTMLNYSDAQFGLSPTWADNDEIIFTNPSMVDGAGYEWNTGTRGSQTNMPNPAGGANITGNTGNGYARITRLN
jgi:hypothetical protein